MRYGVYGKSNAILHAYLAHQLSHMGFDGALLDAQLGADFLVRPAYHQHLQNLLFPIRKGHAASRKDASRRIGHAFNEHRKDTARRPYRSLVHYADRLYELGRRRSFAHVALSPRSAALDDGLFVPARP